MTRNQNTEYRNKMAVNGVKSVTKSAIIPSITILDSDDEQEQTTDELFEGFMKAVKPFLERKELLLLRVKFQAVSPDFKCSTRFKDMLRRKANQVHKVDVYIHFNEVLDAIIRNAAVYGRKRPKDTQEREMSDGTSNSSSQNEEIQPARHEVLAGNFENSEEESTNKPTSSNQSSDATDNDVQFVKEKNPGNSSSSGVFQNPRISKKEDIEKERMKMKRKKLIAKLEDKLKYISDEIKKLSQAELSLEEMEYGDSSYIMENRLKKRFNNTWNKICKLKGRPTNTGRVVEGSIKCKSTGFPAIDRAIAKFLKNRKGFPDIFDIRNIVIRVNKKRGLGLTQMVQNDIAADILTDIGNKLQKKRKKDFEYNFGCHLTDDCLPSKDPAVFDSDLKQKLEENKRVNQNALESVFQKYVHLGRVKGPRNHGTDSSTTTESGSESEEESHSRSKRKAKKEQENSSEDDSEDESPKKKQKKMKISSENKKGKSSVDSSIMSTPSATDITRVSSESSSVEAKNSDSNDEMNSTLSCSEEQALVIDDEMPHTDTTSALPSISVPEVEKPGSLEVEESAEPQNKINELEANQEMSIVDDMKENKEQDVPLTLNSSSSEKEQQTKAPSPQRTKSKPKVNSALEQTNGFGHDDNVIEIIDNDEESVKCPDEIDKIETAGSVQKQTPTFSSKKLLVKIQELRQNQLSKLPVNNPSTNSSVSGNNVKVDSCHSKRKATLVRHITHNQEHPRSSPSNGVLPKRDQDSNISEGQRTEKTLEAPSASRTSDFLPQKETLSLQESISSCPSSTLRNNSLLQSDVDMIKQKPRFSDTPEQRNLSPKVRVSTVSSKFLLNGKLPRPVETVIILSDDEDN